MKGECTFLDKAAFERRRAMVSMAVKEQSREQMEEVLRRELAFFQK